MTHLTVHEWGRVPVGEGGFRRSEADTLLAAARHHPVGGDEGTGILCDHHRHLTARQAVGVLAGEGCSLEILPKVDPTRADEEAPTVRRRLVHMLDVALGLDISAGEAASMDRHAESLLEIFIALFADRLLAEVRRGLPRQYQERENDLAALRGRLRTVHQFTVHAVRPDRLACRFDELSGDTALLRIMKACVLLLSRHAKRAETQRKLSELRFLLSAVADVRRAMLPWRDVRIDRTSRRWTALLELADLLLGARWQETHVAAAQLHGISLLFPMNDLFERYIAVQLRRAVTASGIEVVAQGGLACCLGEWRKDQPCFGNVFRTRPDIILRGGGRNLAVIDTKWKRFGPHSLNAKDGVSQADVYQLMAYARLYQCSRLMLLYPAAPGEASTVRRSLGIALGRERLDLATINISVDARSISTELASLAEALLA